MTAEHYCLAVFIFLSSWSSTIKIVKKSEQSVSKKSTQKEVHMEQLNQFLTDNYHTLSYLYDNSSQDNKISITQQEIADAIGLSRTTVNRIMQELKKDGYLISDDGHPGRYVITQQAVFLLKNLKTVHRTIEKKKDS